MVVPAKRGYKSHVPSACVNCKKAHLACDVSRPCKRCVSAGKGDTCHDVKHKKRGRPKLHEAKRLGNVYGGSMVLDGGSKGMYGMIQTPTFAVATSVVRREHNPRPQTTNISFIHEPIEAFREQDEQRHRRKDINSGLLSQQTSRDPEPPPPATKLPLSNRYYHHSSPPLLSSESSQKKLSWESSYTTARDNIANQQQNQCVRTTITLFLSMEMCCARASDEVTISWGYHPQDLLHRSLYEMISPHDTDRLGRLHRLLLDNVMDVARQHDRSIGPDIRPPPAERTSSPLFYETKPEALVSAAKGSSTFSDTIHIKKQNEEHELYEILVYLGGGLGADLSLLSSLNKLYIVAELKKHEYKVYQNSMSSMSQAALPVSLSFDRTRLFSPFVHSSPTSSKTSQDQLQSLSPPSSNNKNKDNNSNSSSSSSPSSSVPASNKTNNDNSNKSTQYRFGRLGSGGLLQARQGSLPNHFTANSQLNTVSLPSRKLDIPKINIAPMTNNNNNNNKKRSFNMGSVPYFRPIAAATDRPKSNNDNNNSFFQYHHRNNINNNSDSVPSPPRESTNPYSTLAYRFAPITSSNDGKAVGSPRRGPPSYTHPTTQYFLQTSSSTLNAAASAAQSRTRPITQHNPTLDNTMADNDKAVGKTDSNRKAEMSIRSLLC
ncbi:hypothetical protein BDC45DRAFT_501845 [Circinella umbellata]|nr:hypothetical protein BDC45DRAFT_501845 [Circinella umbellata]